MNWYYAVGSQQQGPVTDEQLQALVKDGVVTGDTLVWRDGMANWQPYRTQVAPGTPPVPGAVAADAAPRAALPAQSQFTPRAEAEYGGFWIRFCAKILDGFVVGIPIAIVVVVVIVAAGGFAAVTGGGRGMPVWLPVVQIIVQLVSFGLSVLYNTIAIGAWGTTLGKKACGLKVIKSDGSKVSYGRACGRAFAEILSGMICYIGYIIAGFDSQKRALHDHMCDTRVVRDR